MKRRSQPFSSSDGSGWSWASEGRRRLPTGSRSVTSRGPSLAAWKALASAACSAIACAACAHALRIPSRSGHRFCTGLLSQLTQPALAQDSRADGPDVLHLVPRGHVDIHLQSLPDHLGHFLETQNASGQGHLGLHADSFHELHGAVDEGYHCPVHDVSRGASVGQVVDDLRLGEDRAHAGDGDHIFGGCYKRSDLIRVETHLAGSLLNEGPGSSGALVIQPERLDACIAIEAHGFHRLSADIQHSSGIREEESAAARGCRKICDVDVAEGNLVTPVASADNVTDITSAQTGHLKSQLERLL